MGWERGNEPAYPKGDDGGVELFGELLKVDPGLVVRQREGVADDGPRKGSRGHLRSPVEHAGVVDDEGGDGDGQQRDKDVGGAILRDDGLRPGKCDAVQG